MIGGGVDLIQLRGKNRTMAELAGLAKRLHAPDERGRRSA